MKKLIILIATVVFYTTSLAVMAATFPCSEINRTLADKDKLNLAATIADQLKKDFKNVKNVEVLQSYQYENWRIIYVATHVSDAPFLFYSGDPKINSYVTLWSGGAKRSEEEDIYRWVLSHAKGIPSKLARCFSWHVTNDRDL
ncbi:MAG: hypothetical protein ACXVCP_09120 [Bdellovibrio sp.]